MPSPASLHLSGEPADATQHLMVRLLDDDPGWRREGVFDPGDPIVVDFAVSSREYRLESRLPECSLVVALGPDAETDVVMHILDAGRCSFEVVGAHPLDQSHEPSVSPAS